MQENEQLNPEDLQVPQLATKKLVDDVIEETIGDVELDENLSVEDLEKLKAALTDTVDDLNKKNYIKISPTFYIQPVETEEDEKEVDGEEEVEPLFKVLNPETGEVETRELTDDEKKEIKILELKRDRIRFSPTRHPVRTVEMTTVEKQYGTKKINVSEKIKAVATNETVNKYGSAYKAKRKRRNKLAKASRKANR